MPKQVYKFNFSVSAESRQEANEIMSALASLVKQLDTPALKAIAKKIPAVLSNPLMRGKAKAFLGIK